MTCLRILLAFVALSVLSHPGNAQNIEWQPVNTGLWGGTFGKVIPHPSGTLFAITYSYPVNHLYRSTDQGGSWELLDTDAPELSAEHLIVFAGGDILVSTDRPYLLHSSNEGDTWSRTSIDTSLNGGLALHPSGDVFGVHALGQVFRSSDRGLTWKRLEPDTPSWIFDLDITPSGTLLLATPTGVLRSLDHGASWVQAGFQDVRVEYITVASDGSIFIPVVEQTPDGSPHQICLHRSTDEGETWEGITCPAEDMGVDAVGILGTEKLFIATNRGPFISPDQGITWEPGGDFSSGYPRTFNDSFLWFDEKIYLATWEQGILISEDQGQSWYFTTKGLTATVITTLAAHPDGVLYAGTENHGLFRSQDHGATWQHVELEDSTSQIYAIAISEAGDIFVAGGYLYRSSDNGLTWTMLDIDCADLYNMMSIAPDGTLYLAGGSPDLKRIGVDDESCELVTDELGPDINTIAFANNGDLLVGTGAPHSGDYGIFRSSDSGITWEPMNMTPNNEAINELLVRPNGIVLAGPTRSGLFRSEDDGHTFIKLDNPWPFYGYVSEFLVPLDGSIYTATLGGIYRSMDEGLTWADVGGNLPSNYLHSATLDSQGYLYVGTHGAGVYRSTQPVSVARESLAEVPDAVSLKPNFPNPFHSETTISFSVDRTVFVRVSIYNALGQEVAVLAQDHFAPGEHQLTWRPEPAATGSYFCRIRTDDHTAVRPLTLIR